ncbi:DNA repair protein [Sparassis crispa]|uniref:DNA repair protein REV1 n=1 Tax=Sparassis crispa TaxID=139825 RepID=A0A401GKY1_9APHY|nr:DNA repair protein [Sparassis crispa]GBE82816.1 DNA repair protein [Sparassis crispa]
MAPLTASGGSASSDYFDDDPSFLNALNNVVLDGDITHQDVQDVEVHLSEEDVANSSTDIDMPPCTQPGLKRVRSPDTDEDKQSAEFRQGLNDVDPSYTSSYTYGASRFGEWGEYMSRKRAKLQIQNAEMDVDDGDGAGQSRIFRSLQIYINGWTEPSVQDLRKLIIRHGGIYHPYLDKKSLVTHIITCSLTPAKIREFKYMKVVTPEWLVESAKVGALLPWHDFIFSPGERVEDSQGKKAAQKSLFDGFVSQSGKLPERLPKPKNSSKLEEQTASDDLLEDDSLHPVVTPLKPPTLTPPHTPPQPSTSTSPHALYITDPASPEQAVRVPGYAAHTSNPIAERVMADPAWRAAHTSVAPDFIEGFYRNSRLHHLSTWKAELKNLVAEAQERVESGGASAWGRMPGGTQTAVSKIVQQNFSGSKTGGSDVSMKGAQLALKSPGKEKGKAKAADSEERVIMHCDFDSFFVSAGLIDRPHLRGKPVVVCHSQGTQGGGASTSEIASASYEARKFGIKSGMSLQQARKLCPTIMTMPYEFQRYKTFSLQFYTILMAHADDLQAVSVDEALIDVTTSVSRIKTEIAQSQDPSSSPSDPAKEFAEAIRSQVKKVTGCEISVGISHNIMLARLASRRAKPAGSFHILQKDVSELLAPLDIDDLHGFGYSARQKAQDKLGVTNLGELEKKSKAVLCEALGKVNGETLYNALRGVDDRKLESDKPRKSVSCDINYGIRFENNEQAETFIYQMAAEVARRLNSIDTRGRSLTLKIMKRDPSAPVEAPKFMGHGLCECFNKQTPLIAPGGHATSDEGIIGEHAWRLLKSFNFDPKELRGIGIQIQKLEKSSASTATEPGQAVLPFMPVDGAKVIPPTTDIAAVTEKSTAKPQISVQPPSQDDDIQVVEPPPKAAVDPTVVDLPSFSQVDMSVFQALPDEVRKELETEYTRRSVTPAPGLNTNRSRSSTLLPDRKQTTITVKGTNVKRITQQLAPRSRPSISPTKNKLFAKRTNLSVVNISERELRKLDIDPEVFAILPPDLQREQLAMARSAKAPGASVYIERKMLKPPKPKAPSVPYRRAPPPQAKYLEPLFLKQRGATKDEKLYFTETDDVQRVIETWVCGFTEHPPHQRDVDFFAKFLVQCVDGARSTDTGVEKAVAVARWWLLLLRRHFAMWEHASEADADTASADGRITSEVVGRAWWKAFREVKTKMDVVARRKFGGCLSLR